MSNIVIAFPKKETVQNIKKILSQSGYSVQAVCTTGAQALASANNLENGILISGSRFIDMMYMEIHDYLPPEFQMLLIASPASIQEREVENLVCLALPMKVHELLQTLEMMEGEIRRRRKKMRRMPKQRSEEDRDRECKGTSYGTKQVLRGRGPSVHTEAEYGERNRSGGGLADDPKSDEGRLVCSIGSNPDFTVM